jgi:hypothetical protein
MRRGLCTALLLTTAVTTLAGCDAMTTQPEPQASADAAPTEAAQPRATLVADSGQCDTPTTPFCDSTVPLPPGWDGHVFKLAQNYPASAPEERGPWLAFDPVRQPDQYLRAALDYFYEGNIRESVEDSFDPALNTKRGWYNAPWQDVGFNGREPAHGLTRERTSRVGELDPKQTKMWNNYAVGFYNAPGAVTIGKVWANRGAPDSRQGIAPEGTLAAKLLFTTAGPDQAPYLAGSPTWQAYVYKDLNSLNPTPARAKAPVRLLQIDIAVKDRRAPLGWVFGTFVYGGGPGGKPGAGWRNVQPVGVMWGNDPDAKTPAQIKQSWINPAVKMPHLGALGRLNGPVDNPASSCMSCHMTAQDPPGQMFPPSFANLPAGTPFTPGANSLDYSLQLAAGIQNFKAKQAEAKAAPNSPQLESVQATLADTRPPRDGATTH